MERAKLIVPPPRQKHSVTPNHVGIYYASSPDYSRGLCLKTILRMDPEVKTIFIKLGGRNHELARRSRKLREHGQVSFHFNACWKIKTVYINN